MRLSNNAEEIIVSNLADLKKGAKGKVAYLHTGDNKKLRKLMTMGILPGVLVEVVQTFPSHVFKIGHMQIAVDKEMAKDIFIRPRGENNKNSGYTDRLRRLWIRSFTAGKY